MPTDRRLVDTDALGAARIATEVGHLLLELQREWRRRPESSGRKVIGAEGDRQAQQLLVRLLAQSHPNDAILSEEGKDDEGRLSAPRVWVVDPLDGTREFGEGRDDWAVHVALVQGEQVTAAAVALPARAITLATDPPPPSPPPATRALRLVVSRSRAPAVSETVRAALHAELMLMGSAGAKAMAVVLGEADVYLHAGGQHEWDSAAPTGVAAAAGLHVSRLDGSPLRYNRPKPFLPDLLVCRPELAEPVLDVVAASGLLSET